MASTSETGHAKNVANFNELILFILSYGAVYNPSKAGIRIASLQSLSARAKDAIDLVNSALANYGNAVAARTEAFDPLSKFITRVMNALVATDASQKVEENVRSLVRKIKGARATAKKTEEEKHAAAAEGKSTKDISTSQMSYDSRLANFKKLIQLLESISEYAPNEEELSIAGLNTFYETLKAKNDDASASISPLSNARIARNQLFNADNTGMVDTALDVKAYIKSVYGASSPQYKQVSKLKFTKVKV